MSVDPLAHETLEPYVYTGNNPVMLVDPDGRNPFAAYYAGEAIVLLGMFAITTYVAYQYVQDHESPFYGMSIPDVRAALDIEIIPAPIVGGFTILVYTKEGIDIDTEGFDATEFDWSEIGPSGFTPTQQDGTNIETFPSAETDYWSKMIDEAGTSENDRIIQSGGQVLLPSTLNELKLTKEQGRQAIHDLKDDLGLRNDFHGKIKANGDYLHPSTNEKLGNLYDYVY